MSVELDEQTAAIAREEDWPGWVDIRVGGAEESLPDLGLFDQRTRLLCEAIDAHECIVCERDGRVLGFVIVKREHFFGRDFIDLLFVASDARRQGTPGPQARGRHPGRERSDPAHGRA